MKKFLCFCSIIIAVSCISLETAARTKGIVNGYDTEFTAIGKKCPAQYPYSKEDKEALGDKGVKCYQKANMECYSCDECLGYQYTEENCKDYMIPSDECTITRGKNKGEKKYKNCDCDNSKGYYRNNKGIDVDKTVFTYEEKNSKLGIICYKPTGCTKGNIINASSGLNIEDGIASRDGNACTNLKVVSAFTDTETQGNFWCAKDYKCEGVCSKTKTSHTCLSITTDEDLKDYHEGVNCKYYSGCRTENASCRTEAADATVYESSGGIDWYNINGSKGGSCYQISCILDASGAVFRGTQGLTINGEGITERTPSGSFSNFPCSEYACKTAEGWEKAYAPSDQSINVESAVNNLKEDGKYEVSYVSKTVTTSDGEIVHFFVCRKEIVVQEKCFVNCVAGRYYNNEAKDCYTDSTISDEVYVSGNKDKAKVFNLAESTEQEITNIGSEGIVATNNLTKAEAQSIVGLLKEKYGAGKCFATSEGIELLNENGSFTDITKDEDLKQCCPLTFHELWDGKTNTAKIVENVNRKPAVQGALDYWEVSESNATFGKGNWYLPALGELMDLYGMNYSTISDARNSGGTGENKATINNTFQILKNKGVTVSLFGNENYWSSSTYGWPMSAWQLGMESAYRGGSHKNNRDANIRPFLLLENKFNGGIAIGDVVYSDLSFSKAENYNASKTLVGVVAWVSDSGRSVKLVSRLNQGTVEWGDTTDISSMTKFKDENLLEIFINVATGKVLRHQQCSGEASTVKSTSNRALFDGKANTDAIIAEIGYAGTAAKAAREYYPENLAPEDQTFGKGKWYLPALGEWYEILYNSSYLKLLQEEGVAELIKEGDYWSSTEAAGGNAWLVNIPGKTTHLGNTKQNLGYVRPFITLENMICFLFPGDTAEFSTEKYINVGDIVYHDKSWSHGSIGSSTDMKAARNKYKAAIAAGKKPIGIVTEVSKDGGSIKVMALKDVSASQMKWGNEENISGIDDYNQSAEQALTYIKTKRDKFLWGDCRSVEYEPVTCSSNQALYDGVANTNIMISEDTPREHDAAFVARNYYAVSPTHEIFGKGKWYLPAIGEWFEALGANYSSELASPYVAADMSYAMHFGIYVGEIENTLTFLRDKGVSADQLSGRDYWSSSEEYFTNSSGESGYFGQTFNGAKIMHYLSHNINITVRPFLLIRNQYCGLIDNPEKIAKVGYIVYSDLSYTNAENYNASKTPIGVVAGVSDDGGSIKVMALKNSVNKYWHGIEKPAPGGTYINYQEGYNFTGLDERYADEFSHYAVYREVARCKLSPFCGTCPGRNKITRCNKRNTSLPEPEFEPESVETINAKVVPLRANENICEEQTSTCPYDHPNTPCESNQALFNGKTNTDAIIAELGNEGAAAKAAREYYADTLSPDDPTFGRGKWYLPTIGEWLEAAGSTVTKTPRSYAGGVREKYYSDLLKSLQFLKTKGHAETFNSDDSYWSSSEVNENQALMSNLSQVKDKSELGFVRPFMILENVFCNIKFQKFESFAVKVGDVVYNDKTFGEGNDEWDYKYTVTYGGKIPVGIVAGVSDDGGSIKVMALKDATTQPVKWGNEQNVSGIQDYSAESAALFFTTMKNSETLSAFCGKCAEQIAPTSCQSDKVMYNGLANTNEIIKQLGDRATAAKATRDYYAFNESDSTFGKGKWYLPAIGEWMEAFGPEYMNAYKYGLGVSVDHLVSFEDAKYGTTINDTLKLLKNNGEDAEKFVEGDGSNYYWSSTEVYDTQHNYSQGEAAFGIKYANDRQRIVSSLRKGSERYVRAFLLLEEEFCGTPLQETIEVGDIVYHDKSVTKATQAAYAAAKSAGKTPVGVVAGVSDDGGSIKVVALKDATTEKVKWQEGDYENISGIDDYEFHSSTHIYRDIALCRKSPFCGTCPTSHKAFCCQNGNRL